MDTDNFSIDTDISRSCTCCRCQILECRFRNLRKCERNLSSLRHRNESCRQGSQLGHCSRTSQGKWPRCKRSAIKFEKPKRENRCPNQLTQPPVQFESRRSACQFSTAQLTSAVACLDQPRFLTGGRDSGILEKLSGTAAVLSMARFAYPDYHD
jgi:hypothetical protein